MKNATRKTAMITLLCGAMAFAGSAYAQTGGSAGNPYAVKGALGSATNNAGGSTAGVGGASLPSNANGQAVGGVSGGANIQPGAPMANTNANTNASADTNAPPGSPKHGKKMSEKQMNSDEAVITRQLNTQQAQAGAGSATQSSAQNPM